MSKMLFFILLFPIIILYKLREVINSLKYDEESGAELIDDSSSLGI